MCNSGARERVAPEDADWSILIDRCYRCGVYNPVFPERLSKDQKDWLEKRNKVTKDYNSKNGIKNCE